LSWRLERERFERLLNSGVVARIELEWLNAEGICTDVEDEEGAAERGILDGSRILGASQY
jgi:hypothetical protein